MRPVRQAAERARRHHPSGDLRIRTIRRPRRQGRLKCATGGWRRSGWCPFRISALAERLPRSARQDRSGLFFYESAAHEYGLPPWYRVGRASLSAYILSTAPNCWQKLAQLKARRETLQVVATQISSDQAVCCRTSLPSGSIAPLVRCAAVARNFCNISRL